LRRSFHASTPFFAHGGDDAGVDGGVLQVLPSWPHEQRDRHAPGALAESTQSGRPSTIAPMRLRPFSGMNDAGDFFHRAFRAGWARRRAFRPRVDRAAFASQPFSAGVLAGRWVSGLSIGTNHCGVQRKITLALERHECG
jgi:hypothetical protein